MKKVFQISTLLSLSLLTQNAFGQSKWPLQPDARPQDKEVPVKTSTEKPQKPQKPLSGKPDRPVQPKPQHGNIRREVD